MTSVDEVKAALSAPGILFSVGPFQCLLRSEEIGLASSLFKLYQDYPIFTAEYVEEVPDFDIEVSRIKRHIWADPQVVFQWRGYPPLPELPLSQAHPLFEWGLNWCIATLMGTEIVIHAAIVERNGTALVLPGEPGAGKSTLCAALVMSGWRLLSDELTIISIQSGLALPVPRPISLKADSIQLIKERFPEAQLTIPVTETRKGMIAYVRPPTQAVERWKESVPIGCFLYPKFEASSGLSVKSVSAAESLSKLMASTFNVGLIGHEGFTALAEVVRGAQSYSFEYGDLAQALSWIDQHCFESFD